MRRGPFEGVIVPTALHEAETWGMRRTERRKPNEEVRRRAGIEKELASEWIREYCDGLHTWSECR